MNQNDAILTGGKDTAQVVRKSESASTSSADDSEDYLHFWYHIHKIIVKTNVMQFFPYIFFYKC